MIVSGAVVAFAPNYAVPMAGRALPGVAVGGFWSMSTSTVMRLVPSDDVPKALAILNCGAALTATVAAPLSSFLGAYIGWRGAFAFVVQLAGHAFLWPRATLPSLPVERQSSAGTAFRLLGRPQVALGMSTILFLYMGQFTLFTYLRPFLERVTQVGVAALSLILLVLGVTGLIGSYTVGWLLRKSLHGVLIVIPLDMAAIALLNLGHWQVAMVALIAAWGLIRMPTPVGWRTWLARGGIQGTSLRRGCRAYPPL